MEQGHRPGLIVVLVSLALAAGCNSGSGEDSANEEPSADEPADETAQAEPSIPCELVTAQALIESVELSSADGSCRLFLPAGASPGTFDVRVSGAGQADVAAIEVRTDDGTLYATTGTVTLETATDGHYVGTIDAEDGSPPHTGAIRASFDVSR